MSPHTHTIQQNTPTTDTHNLDHQDGVRRPEREKIVAGTSPTPTWRSRWYQLPSRKEMQTKSNGFASTQWYVIVVARSKITRWGLQRVYYKCDCGGTYKNNHNFSDGEKKRRTSSRLMECSFKGRGDGNADGIWTFGITTATHNHSSSLYLAGHSIYQKLSHELVVITKGLLDATVPPQSIQKQSKLTHGINVPLKKLYHTIQQLFKKELNGKSPVEVLVKAFRDEAYEIELVLDDCGRVTHCFFAHPAMVELMRLNHDVLGLDSTYKTNKYRLLLLHVVGFTALYTTFSATFVFMNN